MVKCDPSPARLALVLTTLVLVAWLSPSLHAQILTRNILLVIADDYGIDSQSLYNSHPNASLPPTPHLNALAARGVRFANACAYPVCSPTRSALLTGRYGFRTGVLDVLDSASQQGLYANEVTLPELLVGSHRSAGFGKWHLGGGATGPNVIGGWSHFSGSLPGALGMNATNFWLWTKTTNGVSRPNHFGYATTDNVNDALSWIGEQGTNRWFLCLGFNAPHTPYHLPPTNLCPHYAALSGTSTDLQQNPRRYYEAAVEAMDTELGRLLAGIDPEETTVLFVGDNGTPSRVIQPPYNLPGRAKGSLHEGGVRVPFVIAGPDVARPGRVSSEVVHVVDLFATVLDLAALDATEVLPAFWPLDSRSLLPILRDEPFQPSELAVLMEASGNSAQGMMPGRAVRFGQYKLIQRENGSEEYYDLSPDPMEATNLLTQVLTSSEQSVLNQLRTKLDSWNNAPVIHAARLGSDGFSLVTAWYANAGGSLWRDAAPPFGAWSVVTNAVITEIGQAIRFVDPQPPVGAAFYRLWQE